MDARFNYDIIIIGSGPAGMFCADQLCGMGLRIAIVEKTRFSSGGMLNDCKLNLTPDIGIDDVRDSRISVRECEQLIEYIDLKFLQHGALPQMHSCDDQKIAELQARCARFNAKLITNTRQRHVGTDKARALIASFRKELESAGIEFRLEETVSDIEKLNGEGFKIFTDKAELMAKILVVAPGRGGMRWFRTLVDEKGDLLPVKYEIMPAEIGVRVEMPFETFKEVTDAIYDPKIRVMAPNGNWVKTFCTNPRGSVRPELPSEAIHYKGHELRLVNGDSLSEQKTENTNFALLCKYHISPQDSESLIYHMLTETFRVGNWRIIAQRMGKFLNHRRSWDHEFRDGLLPRPTLPLGFIFAGDINATPMPPRVIFEIQHAIRILDQIFPGVAHPHNIVYAPEAKLQNVKYVVSNTLETTVPGLYVAGNGAGLSSGIVGAAVNGILAGRGIRQRLSLPEKVIIISDVL